MKYGVCPRRYVITRDGYRRPNGDGYQAFSPRKKSRQRHGLRA